ncbi:MAG: EscS/YscS/HrcS family type III secretion system export apparatus protein [Nitrospirae bacterium RIFCSPLOW2_12_42_9]|nr:MAG: EscS/YscS/HrcS family type III secretion system export apparatus protein [Nitrospirae bacterium GWA2_42_11]OGW54651.1 MAG: EscS/YscS/HrcS family type III secretion system export apparatus protein [Nitrospirae bacterium RIFCSPLOWO2_02_42_7]OGW56670.1 MAG: EscS/YscS/HrcS family type III secretion system export apparatus protein [Nitrospirae bacterium RIFCSPHIGHO2_02_FULL_42_12]OGW60969.1 MAG: EscS/YscS/HrcS family type III secretion system export apparatus protein [Nitrospirae bacterium RI
MTPELVISIGKSALETAVLISAPILLLSLIIGLIISIFQAVTQINEATLTFVPKILVTFIALLIFFPWMLRIMLGFTTTLFTNIPAYVH